MPASPVIVPAGPALWRKTFLDLRPSVVPCPGFTALSWANAREKCGDFLDQWADEAAALGWTTLEPFGLHPQVVTIRSDFCVALVLSGERVSGITETRMRFVNTNFHWDTPGCPDGAVPL